MITDSTKIAASPRSLLSELLCPICLDLLKTTMTTKEVSGRKVIIHCIIMTYYSAYIGSVKNVSLQHYVVGRYASHDLTLITQYP